MVTNGYIKIFRSLLSWEWYEDANTFRVFIHLLLTASYEVKKWRGLTIEKGARVCSIATLASELDLSPREVRTALEHLESTGEITQASYPKFRIVKIVKFDKFQKNDKVSDKISDKVATSKATKYRQGENPSISGKNDVEIFGSDKVSDRKTTSKAQAERQTSDKQATTSKEYKEYKEYKEGGEEYACACARAREEAPPPTPPTLEEVRLFCSERNSSVNPARFYNYNAVRNWKGVTDWKLKLEEWESNEYASEDKAKAEKLSTYMSAGGHGEHLNLDMFDEARGPEKDTGGWVYEV